MMRKHRLQRSFNRRRSRPYRARLQEAVHAMNVFLGALNDKQRRALQEHIRARAAAAVGLTWREQTPGDAS